MAYYKHFICLRSSLSQRRRAVAALSRITTTMMIMSLLLLLLFFSSITITSSSSLSTTDCFDSVEKTNNDELQQNDIMEHDSTNIVGKWDDVKEDDNEKKQGDNHHLNDDDDIMTTRDNHVALVRREMTEECVTNETGLRLAVDNASNNYTIITDVNICVHNIPINSEINILNKFIKFNCILPLTEENNKKKCQLDGQFKSRHFYIQSSNILFNKMIFINGKVIGNSDNGGSLYIYNSSIISILDCDFINNEVKNYYGGAIYIIDSSIISLSNVIMNSNKAGYGGAIYINQIDNINIINTNITNNIANLGGGIYSWKINSGTMTNVILHNNSATIWGGAVYSAFSNFIITDMTLTNNYAKTNGSCFYSFTNEITMTNIEAYNNYNNNNSPNKSVCEIYQESSRIEISKQILESSMFCYDFPKPTNNKPSSSPITPKPTTVLLQPTILPPQYSPTITGCVTDERSLLSSIRNIPDNSSTPTNIELCAKYIAINLNKTSGMTRYSGINLIGKFVNFTCTLENPKDKCTIDAQQGSRHFYIKSTKLSFHRITFMNGNVMTDFQKSGGSLWIELSKIQIRECDFVDGTSIDGGAIYAEFSNIQMTNVSFKNNVGGGIKSGYSEVTIVNGLVTNNRNDYGGAIDAYKSTITMTQVDVTNNIALIDGGAVKSKESDITLTDVLLTNNSVIGMTNVILAKNSELTDGGVISSLISNITMTNVVICANNAKDGIITLVESKINIQKVFFAGAADGDGSDLLFGAFDVDDEDFRYSRVNFPESPPPQTRQKQHALYFSTHIVPESSCINSCSGLIDGVKNCKRTTNRQQCQIYVCSNIISCSQKNFATENSIEYGIDVSNKDIFFHCILKERCILDGSSNTRLFFGSNTNVGFRNFIFANGYDAKSGGAMKIQNDSVVNLLDCTFLKCSSPSGAALSLNNTQFVMEGTITSIINNTGSGASIELLSSKATLYNVFFSGNDRFYNSEMIMFDSTIIAANMSFGIDNYKNNCKIFIAMYRNDFTKEYSCIEMERVNNALRTNSIAFSQDLLTQRPNPSSSCLSVSAPIIISTPSATAAPAKYLTTTPPATVPTTTPPATVPSATAPVTPHNCFSAGNKVQGLDGAYKRIDELKIGDFIKSGNGEFTQVYGFGHMDPSKEGVFLQIYFGSSNRNQTEILTLFPFIEVSPMHLIYVDVNSKKYPIRASDVAIGDKLNGMAVRKIETVVRRGLYAPLTYSGDFIINGVTASNYVDVLDHDWIWNQHVAGHVLFFTQRVLCSYFMEACKREKYIDGYGYLAYVIIYGSAFFECDSFTVRIILLVAIGLSLTYYNCLKSRNSTKQ